MAGCRFAVSARCSIRSISLGFPARSSIAKFVRNTAVTGKSQTIGAGEALPRALNVISGGDLPTTISRERMDTWCRLGR